MKLKTLLLKIESGKATASEKNEARKLLKAAKQVPK